MTRFFLYCFNDNTGLLINLQKNSLGSLLSKAEQLEKKYEWLQVSDYYKKEVDLALRKKQLKR